jgi:hypothetical protein
MHEAQALYDLLRGEASKFAAVSTLSLDDVRQTLYLMCLEHVAGQDSYNPLLGTPENYIMGRLWGLVERWRPYRPLEENDHCLPDNLKVPGVDELLIDAAQRLVEERVRDDLASADRKAAFGVPTSVALVTHGDRTVSEVARLWGKSRWRVRKAVHQHRITLETGGEFAGQSAV